MNTEQIHQVRALTDKRLLMSTRILMVVFILLLGSVIFETAKYSVQVLYPLGGLVIGALAGVLFSRMRRISWDESASLIVGRTDLYGGIILVLYVLFDLNRTRLLAHFFSGETLAVVSLSVLVGIMYGRILGVRNGIRNVLKAL